MKNPDFNDSRNIRRARAGQRRLLDHNRTPAHDSAAAHARHVERIRACWQDKQSPDDALDPGPEGNFPFFPRHLDGSPAWSERAETDGLPVPGHGPEGMVTPIPRGRRAQLVRGTRVEVDVTPTGPDGNVVDPPDLGWPSGSITQRETEEYP